MDTLIVSLYDEQEIAVATAICDTGSDCDMCDSQDSDANDNPGCDCDSCDQDDSCDNGPSCDNAP